MVEALILKLREIDETSTVEIRLSLGLKTTTVNLYITRTLKDSNQVKAILQIKCLVVEIL